jgi:hypothetical protein
MKTETWYKATIGLTIHDIEPVEVIQEFKTYLVIRKPGWSFAKRLKVRKISSYESYFKTPLEAAQHVLHMAIEEGIKAGKKYDMAITLKQEAEKLYYDIKEGRLEICLAKEQEG